MECSDEADLSPQKQSALLNSDFNLGVEHPCGVHNDNSSRSKLVQAKFPNEFKSSEKFIDNFCCALSGPILIQGTIYVTTRCCYFYSPIAANFSSFTKGTKVKMAYSDLATIKKENRLNVFPS